ncbi:NAD(P)H-hydrate dehydratase [uncultured Paracoccus sp.]|uniref:NAD(P)H-hydrate dehydratase n=1 Tax=uncultured Paracoccus sp. TaxID=189685 RepID=UPI00261B8C6A|nr:NAD(P)H-hydrate dehydratase [uncultured Paracoccus sp.]
MLNGTQILTTAQMRAIESAAMDSGAVTGLELMERAGAAVVAALLERWPDPRRAFVLCGPGNNGGDGFVIARLLKDRGTEVTTLFLGERDRLSPDAAVNHDRWQQMLGERDLWLPDPAEDTDLTSPDFEIEIGTSTVVVDAILGTGSNRPLPSAWASHLLDAVEWGSPVIAVDALSGLDLDSGRFAIDGRERSQIVATLTVTFQRAKVGHKLEEGPDRSGELVVADIGLEQNVRRYFEGPYLRHEPVPSIRLTSPALARPLSKSSGHKFDHGHALILAGTTGRGGAARLATRAALRCGAGLVTLACPRDAIAENAASLPDAVMLRPLDEPDELRKLLADKRINAICAGPGLGVERAAMLLPVLAEDARDPKPVTWVGNQKSIFDLPFRTGRPTVLDADALTAGAAQGPAFLQGLHVNTILTPHEGEFARVFPDLGARLKQKDPTLSTLEAVREAADRAKAVILLKGPTTVISANARRLRSKPPVEAWINSAAGPDAVPWLATAGSGDVLAGIITGLLARGLPPLDAAATGAWLHAAAARRYGPGLIADDLPDQIPGLFRDLGL